MKLGDVVRLKSGGPAMTLAVLPDPEEAGSDAQCIWMHKNDQLEMDVPLPALEPWTAEGSIREMQMRISMRRVLQLLPATGSAVSAKDACSALTAIGNELKQWTVLL